MKLFGFNVTRQSKPLVIDTQVRDSWESPFQSTFDSYKPFQFNLDLFHTIREALPIADIGIIKWTRLLGDFRLDAFGNERVQQLLNDFKQRVPVGWFDVGFTSFQERIFDSGLESGMGIGEIIPEMAGNGINRLKVANPKIIRFVRNNNGELVLGQLEKDNFTAKAFPFPEYINYFGPDKRIDNPQGFSMFWGLPFISQIWQRITKSIENQVWRLGDPSFVAWIEGGEGLNSVDAKKLQTGLTSKFKTIFQARREGKTGDIFAVGPHGTKLNIGILGEKGIALDLSIPVETCLNQIVPRIGLPPYMLGLKQWNSTERMATWQNDMVVTQINSYRRNLDPIIEQIFDTFLIMTGNAGVKYKWEWNAVNLLDEKELAISRSQNATANEKEILNTAMLIDMGWLEIDEGIDRLIEHGIITEKQVRLKGREAIAVQLFKRFNNHQADKIMAQMQ